LKNLRSAIGVIGDSLEVSRLRRRYGPCLCAGHDTGRTPPPIDAFRRPHRALLPDSPEFVGSAANRRSAIDASTSVAMNYRAAGRARSHREFTAKLGLVVEEADESVGWMELIAELELAGGTDLTWLLGESRELVAIFGSSYATAKRNDRRSPDRRSPNRQAPGSPSAATP
jgi:four helix bundle protein